MIIEHYKSISEVKINDCVKITDGRFEGLNGKVIDIDERNNKRPLAVEIDEIDFEGICYIGYDDVKI